MFRTTVRGGNFNSLTERVNSPTVVARHEQKKRALFSILVVTTMLLRSINVFVARCRLQVARNGLKLMQDPFGNYVVQYVLKTCTRCVYRVY